MLNYVAKSAIGASLSPCNAHSYLLGVVGLLLALRARLAGAGLLPELLQTGLQLQLLLARLAQLPRLLTVHGLQLATQLPLLGAQLPEPCRLTTAQGLQLLDTGEREGRVRRSNRRDGALFSSGKLLTLLGEYTERCGVQTMCENLTLYSNGVTALDLHQLSVLEAIR